MCLVAEETSKTHMNALPGVDWRIAFSLAPTGLTRFFGMTQAKAWVTRKKRACPVAEIL
jgi:hypothetical protein